MDVTLRRILPLWFDVIMGILSFGLYPLLSAIGRRHVVRRMDPSGLISQDGSRIAWGEITSVAYGPEERRSLRVAKQLRLSTPAREMILPIWRATNAAEVTAYIIAHAPPGTWQVPHE